MNDIRQPAVKVGHKFTCARLGECEVVRVLPMGTIEIKNEDGKYFRLSGLPFTTEERS